MSSKNKTPLGLSQWEGTEVPERLDFNSDNLLTDWALMERVKKVENAKAGNFAVLTGDGGIQDSGKSVGDFKAELGKKADLNATQIDALKDLITLKTGTYRFEGIVPAGKNYPPKLVGTYIHVIIVVADRIDFGGTGYGTIFIAVHDGSVYSNALSYTTWTGWRLFATATPPQEFDLQTLEGFSRDTYGKNNYYKNQFNEVTVMVSIKKADDGAFSIGRSTAAMLPEGFRPNGSVFAAAIIVEGVSAFYAGELIAEIDGKIEFYNLTQMTGKSSIFGIITFIAR